MVRPASASAIAFATASIGGAEPRSAPVRPVRRSTARGTRPRGRTRVSSVATSPSPGESRTAPNSMISAPASAASPVVSRSTTARGPCAASQLASPARSTPSAAPRRRSGLTSNVDPALELAVLAQDHVHERGLAALGRALERGAELLRPLDELAVAAERLDDLIVARVAQQRRARAVPAVHAALRPHHLAPGGVVADDADDREAEAHGRVVLEAVQAEGAVAVDDHDAAPGVGELRGEREGHADAERAQRARVHPRALAAHRQDLRRGRDDVAAVADD